MICPFTFEKYNFNIKVNTREIMKNTSFFEGLRSNNVEYLLGWGSYPPEMAIGPIWFKTEEDLNIAKLLI